MIRSIFQHLRIGSGVFSRFFKFHWASLCRFLSLTTHRVFHLWWPVPNQVPKYPPTSEQQDERQQAFLQSIDKSAVAALASRFNNQKECVVSDDVQHGSYNVCLFVTFPADKTRWVVRIPMSHSVSDGWTKLQSEVATMRYIERNTTIPIPKVHAYGNGERLTDNPHTTQAFLIMDHLTGQPLQLDALCSATPDKRNQFYADFASILAQLHELQFPKAGSLYPHGDDDAISVIGPSLYSVENDLQVQTGVRPKLASGSNSTTAVIRHHYDMLVNYFDIPSADVIEETAMHEIFALDSVADLLSNCCSSPPNAQSFALWHGDLRGHNILVDDDLRIQGILDWEWVTILPRQLCTPPLWICGHESAMKIPTNKKIYEDFQRAVSVDHKYYEYLKFWKEEELCLSIALILRHPCHLVPIHNRHIHSKFHKVRFYKMADAYFASEDKQRILQDRLGASERYTNYLKQKGLYVPDPQKAMIRDYIERFAKLEKELAAVGM